MDQKSLRRFFHDLAGPLSAVALHLESASRSLTRGSDATPAIARAKEELEKAFELFEGGRAALLGEAPANSEPTSP